MTLLKAIDSNIPKQNKNKTNQSQKKNQKQTQNGKNPPQYFDLQKFWF